MRAPHGRYYDSCQLADYGQPKAGIVFGDRETDELARQEFDGVAADLFWTDRPTEENQTSYELRLESDWSDSLRSTVGVFLLGW